MTAAKLNLLSALLVGTLTALLGRTALLVPDHTQISKRPIAPARLQNLMVQRGDGFDHYQQALAAAAAKPKSMPNWLGHYVLSSGLSSEGLTLGPQGEFVYYLQGCLGKSNRTLGQFTLAAGTISLVAQPFSAKFATDLIQKPPYESQYSSMEHDWQLRWWLDDAGQRSAPFLMPTGLTNDFIAELRDGCFDPMRLKAAWREVDASKRLRGQPELTPAQRARVLRKTIAARVLALQKPKGAESVGGYLRLTLDRGERDGVFVGEAFDYPFRVISVLENSAVVEGLNGLITKRPNLGDALTSSAPGTLIPCPSELNLSVDAAFPARSLH